MVSDPKSPDRDSLVSKKVADQPENEARGASKDGKQQANLEARARIKAHIICMLKKSHA